MVRLKSISKKVITSQPKKYRRKDPNKDSNNAEVTHGHFSVSSVYFKFTNITKNSC